jgi:hypothetical protein
MKKLTILILAGLTYLGISFVHAKSRSTIGDYHLSFGYQHVGTDYADYGGIGLGFNYPVHPNVDLGAGFAVGQLSVDSEDALQWDIGVNGKIHKKFELKDSFLKSVDPFIQAGVGITVVQQFYWGYTGSSYSYNYYDLMSVADSAIPWSLVLGTEFKLGEMLSLVPAIGTGGYFDLDVDSSFTYGLSANVFFSERWSASIGFAKNPDREATSFLIGVNSHR